MSIAKRNFNDELNKFIDEFISKNKESKILHIPPEFKSKGNLAPNPPKPVQKKKKGLWGLLKTPIKDLLPSSEVLNDKEKENNIKKTLSFKDYHKSIYPNDEILMYIDPYFIFTKRKIYFLIYEGYDESAEKSVKSLKSGGYGRWISKVNKTGISYHEISSINFQRWKKKDKIYDFGLGVFSSILCAALCSSFIITEITSNTNIIWLGALFGLLVGIQKDKPAMIFTKKSATKNESHTLDQFSHSNLSFNLFEKFRSEFLIFFNEYQKEEKARIINEQKQKEKRLAEEEKRKAAEEKRKAAEEKRRIEQSDKLRIKEYNDSLQQIVEKINKAGSPEKIEENILNSLLKANEISIASKDKEYSNPFSLKFVRLSNFLKIQRENLIETYLSIKNDKLKDFETPEHTIEQMQAGANIVETLNASRKRRGIELIDRASEEELVFGTGVFTEEDKEEIIKNKVESNIEKAEMLALDIIRYHTLHFKSVEMIALLIEDKKIDFYRLYEVFDQLNVFDSKFQKDNLEKLDSLIEINKELMKKLTEELGAVGTSISVAIKQMQSNLSDSSRAVERTIRNSSNQISQSVDNNTQIVDKQLKKVNNKLFWNNIISGFNAYQNFRINKKLK